MTFLVPYAHPGAGLGISLDVSSLLKSIDPSQALKDAAGKVGLTQNTLDNLGNSLQSSALTEAAKLATDSTAVKVNRARIAAVANLGYSYLDTYQRAKPSLFILGLAGTTISSMALAKRRKNPEAVALYSILAVVSIATAWFTRPDLLKSAAAKATPPESNPNAPGAVKSSLTWADNRVAKLTARQPGWEGATLTRLIGDFGSGTIPPGVKTLLTRNAH